MMLCVQFFSLHAHFTDDGDHHHSHAHSHVLDDIHDHHLNTDHEDEDSVDILGMITKKLHIIDLCLFTLLAIFSAFFFKSNTCRSNNDIQQILGLLFFRPPLRAPPLQY